LKGELNLEGFEFCMLCDLLPNDNEPETVRAFMEICDQYVETNSKKELNISGSIRERIMDAKRKIKIYTWTNSVTPKEMLSTARHSVSNDQKDPFARFISSDKGYEILSALALAKDENVIVKNKFDILLSKLSASGTKENINNLCLQLADVEYHLKFLERAETSSLSISIVLLEHHVPKIEGSQRKLQNSKVTLSKKAMFPYFYTTGLLLDDVLLEWNEYGICNPRHIDSQETLLKFPVMKMDNSKYISHVGQIASLLAAWNITFKAATQPNIDIISPRTTSTKSGESIGNCQDFVNVVLTIFGYSLKSTPYMLFELLDKVKKKGYVEMSMNPSLEFVKKYKFKEIMTHYELDEFMDQCFEMDDKFESNCRDEYSFMKVLDDYMWKKYMVFERVDERTTDPLCAKSRPTFKCCFRRDHISYRHERKVMNIEQFTDVITLEQLEI
jgi:hypothetical protein